MIAILGVVTSTTFGDVRVDYATALYSTSLVTTLYCTTVIVYRVVQVGSRSTIGPGLRSYQGILEILIESSALYFFATLFALVAYTQSGPVSQFASAFWTSVTVSLIRYYFGSVLCRLLTLCWGIAPTLVVARVAAGDARPNQTWNNQAEGPALSFLRFNDFDEESTGGATSGTHKHTDNTKSYVDDVETTALPGKTVSSGSEELHSAEKIV
ncbi:hypothetical protein DXG03_006052 [Asterophora parasitica]|uniref:Uncharacterized protein n=1 Tax=Asterophora parasitica TaxID=117018 RepID=A0A9P7K9M3_9AGAR|nr:hypothetical protein DXG03_006052 [Asterophora parasitica]